MTSARRHVALFALAAIGTVPWSVVRAAAQEPPTAAALDFTYDRGFLIAKGMTLHRGEAYVAGLMPGSIGWAYGLSDRITVQVGTVPWTLAAAYFVGFASARYAVVRASPAHVAIGGFGAAALGPGKSTVAMWPYVTGTLGSRRVSVSALFGVGSSTRIFEGDFDGNILLQASAETQVAPRFKLVAETLYLGRGSEPLVALGTRFLGAQYVFEVGVARTVDDPGQYLPWCAVAVPLGRRDTGGGT
jgi:hypothetical protein